MIGHRFSAIVALVKALFQVDDIDAKLREVVTLRAAMLMNAPYEWHQNTKMTLNVGLDRDEIDVLAVDGPVVELARTMSWPAPRPTNMCGAGPSRTSRCPVS